MATALLPVKLGFGAGAGATAVVAATWIASAALPLESVVIIEKLYSVFGSKFGTTTFTVAPAAPAPVATSVSPFFTEKFTTPMLSSALNASVTLK